MSDWQFLNRHRVQFGPYGSSAADGFNGEFRFSIPGESRPICVIASDGLGWKHVSVSFSKNLKTPSWAVMCTVKDLFFEPTDWVIQFHPPDEAHINNHPGCLHLWKPDSEFPVPPPEMVGIKEAGTLV